MTESFVKFFLYELWKCFSLHENQMQPANKTHLLNKLLDRLFNVKGKLFNLQVPSILSPSQHCHVNKYLFCCRSLYKE